MSNMRVRLIHACDLYSNKYGKSEVAYATYNGLVYLFNINALEFALKKNIGGQVNAKR